ncbi:hypothetical protein BKA64DRAFT_654607, partial [Cadophora sp. MPI-SDFR-AT-0126]
MADLIGMARWEIIHRCVCSYPWRALSDAKLVMEEMYGREAEWEDFVVIYRRVPTHGKGR